MGVPCYFSKLIKNYQGILKKYDSKLKIDNFYLDSNSIIYDIINSLDDLNIDNIIDNVIYKLEEYINTINPTKRIMIAFDGVAPCAKLHQQRERRYKSYVANELFESKKWNTCNITPGTDFMRILMDRIYNHFYELYPGKEVIVSTSNKCGEGEHKIFSKIREKYNKGTTMVYGIDSDLIMLCLSNLKYCEKLVLFRETPFFIKNINKNLEANELYYINIIELRNTIDKTLNKKNSELEYIFIMFFLGNDFLPHFPSLNIRTSGMDILINAYKYCNDNYSNFTLIEDNEIHYVNLNIFLNYLSEQERTNIIDEVDRKARTIKYNSTDKDKLMEIKYLNIPSEFKNVEQCINPKMKNWEDRYYWLLLNIDEETFYKKKLCHSYYKTLYWTFKYYTQDCIDWSWTYDYPYPPLLKDLIDKKYTITLNDFPKETKAITQEEQLYYVVPPDSLELLEKKYIKKKQIELKNTIIQYNWAFCRYMWEGHIHFG